MSSRIGNGAIVVAGLWNRGVVPIHTCTREGDTKERNLEVEVANIAVKPSSVIKKLQDMKVNARITGFYHEDVNAGILRKPAGQDAPCSATWKGPRVS